MVFKKKPPAPAEVLPAEQPAISIETGQGTALRREVKTGATLEVKPEIKPEAKPDGNIETKPEVKPEAKSSNKEEKGAESR